MAQDSCHPYQGSISGTVLAFRLPAATSGLMTGWTVASVTLTEMHEEDLT